MSASRPAGARGARLEYVVRPDRGGSLSIWTCTPRGQAWLDLLPALFRRRDDRLGRHGLDQIQWALGMDESGPVEIWTEGGKFGSADLHPARGKKRGEKHVQRAQGLLPLRQGVICEVGQRPARRRHLHRRKGHAHRRSRRREDPSPPEMAPRDHCGQGRKTRATWPELAGVHQGPPRPRADVEIGHRSATVCHLGNIARWAGRKLRWDPVKEIFPDDAEANAYLDRRAASHTNYLRESEMGVERISLELTNRCANACWFCYNHSQPDGLTCAWTGDEVVGFLADFAAQRCQGGFLRRW